MVLSLTNVGEAPMLSEGITGMAASIASLNTQIVFKLNLKMWTCVSRLSSSVEKGSLGLSPNNVEHLVNQQKLELSPSKLHRNMLFYHSTTVPNTVLFVCQCLLYFVLFLAPTEFCPRRQNEWHTNTFRGEMFYKSKRHADIFWGNSNGIVRPPPHRHSPHRV